MLKLLVADHAVADVVAVVAEVVGKLRLRVVREARTRMNGFHGPADAGSWWHQILKSVEQWRT